MVHLSDDDRRRAFSVWLRTGKLPLARNEDGVEFKPNPWHDPADGRFTSAGSGLHVGTANGRPGVGKRREQASLPIGTRSASTTQGAKPVAASVARPADRPNSAAEFARSAAGGLYDTAAGAAKDIYSALTTNPATTARGAGRAIAGAIDATIAAEDTPARVQVSRTAAAVAHASAHDLGRAAGVAIGNVALALAPGAALSKVSALGRLRAAAPIRVAYDPPKIGWVKENLGRDSPAKLYNDSAPGARPDQAPTLTRTMPDGSTRPVKFDGILGDYVIDRKFSVSGKPRARAQMLRQAEVLAQHRLIGVWEVTSPAQKAKAIKMFKKMNVTNIKVRVSNHDSRPDCALDRQRFVVLRSL